MILKIFIFIDVDECEDAARDGIVLCVDNSKCINTKGSYNCTCFDGFIKINGSCERKMLNSYYHCYSAMICGDDLIVYDDVTYRE